MLEELNKTDNFPLQILGLKKYFPVKKGLFKKTVGWLRAVDGVTLRIRKGESLGLVGESGCGKSTIAKCVLNLLEPTDGEIIVSGINIAKLNASRIKDYRKKVQIIFQDPYASLDPRMSMGAILTEPLKIYSLGTSSEQRNLVESILGKVGLNPEHMSRYPHEFSGGQRQRIGIARALVLQPEVIVCDEPVSALDVSIQAQVINLLDDLKDELKLSYLFIAHDLSVVEHVCDRIAVMYMGKIVEIAKDTDLCMKPLHPYTKALISAIPIPDPLDIKERTFLQGEIPSPIDPPSGCRFRTRCPHAIEICAKSDPVLQEVENEHFCRCWLTHRQS